MRPNRKLVTKRTGAGRGRRREHGKPSNSLDSSALSRSLAQALKTYTIESQEWIGLIRNTEAGNIY